MRVEIKTNDGVRVYYDVINELDSEGNWTDYVVRGFCSLWQDEHKVKHAMFDMPSSELKNYPSRHGDGSPAYAMMHLVIYQAYELLGVEWQSPAMYNISYFHEMSVELSNE